MADEKQVQPEVAKAETPKADASKQEQPKAEAQTNCPSCNKHLKKINKYYRNGKYFCNKKCWQKASKKTNSKEEEKE